MKINFAKAKNSRWYRQQTASRPYFILGPIMGAVKHLNGGQNVFFYFNGKDFRNYCSEDFLKKLAVAELKKIKADSQRLGRLYKNWNAGNRPILTLIDKVRDLNVKNITDKELLQLNRQLAILGQKYWERPIFMDIFDMHAESLIFNELKKYHITVSPKDLATLLLPSELSFVQQYNRNLLPLLGKSISEKDIKKLINQFYFLKSSYASGHALTATDIKSDLAHFKKITAKNHLLDLKKTEATLKKQKAALYKKYKLAGWPKRLLQSFSFLSLWRERRKMVLQKTSFALNKLGQEIALRSGLPWQAVECCLPYAINKIPVPKNLIQKYRSMANENCVCVYNPAAKKIEFLDRAACKKLVNMLETKSKAKILNGQTACEGKTLGTAKVIFDSQDFNKFKKGDILITAMTRPEFLPILRHAAGIITDEGGITCHAAIVSRELNIPCIIGTRSATRIIKNGDRIELDANKGVIKIIK